METIMVSTGLCWIPLVGCSILLEKCTKTHNKREFCYGFTGKANGLCYFNGNQWHFCDGFYCASILFLAGWRCMEYEKSARQNKY